MSSNSILNNIVQLQNPPQDLILYPHLLNVLTFAHIAATYCQSTITPKKSKLTQTYIVYIQTKRMKIFPPIISSLSVYRVTFP